MSTGRTLCALSTAAALGASVWAWRSWSGPVPAALGVPGLLVPLLLYLALTQLDFQARLARSRLRTDAGAAAFLLLLAAWHYNLASLTGSAHLRLAAVFACAWVCVRSSALGAGSRDGWLLGALLALWLPYESGLLPGLRLPGPGGLDIVPVLLLVAAVVLFLIYGRLERVGLDLDLRRKDAVDAAREFGLLALPLAVLGLLLGFIAWSPRFGSLAGEVAKPLGIYFLNALPEEFLFRGVMLNLLARRLGATRALAVSSVVFGLSHVENGGFPNWKYVLMATLAGWFYGRAYLKTGKVTASALVHTAVNWTWLTLFRG